MVTRELGADSEFGQPVVQLFNDTKRNRALTPIPAPRKNP